MNEALKFKILTFFFLFSFFLKLNNDHCRYCTKGIKTLKMHMLPLRYTCENVTHVVIR